MEHKTQIINFDSHRIGVQFEQKKGRAALTNASGRFERLSRHQIDDGWDGADDADSAFDAPQKLKTQVQVERPKRIITRNQSPDISFDRSINPYRGCEHGCSYCFARPSHAFMGLSPGQDFESRLFAKPDAAQLLEQELADPKYVPRVIALGTNTDPYQPIEKHWRITRSILEVMERTNHPVGIVTKSAMVQRDIDILARMAKKGLVKVALSVTTLDRELSRKMEPRAATPEKRLETLQALHNAGIPTAMMVAPIIPGLNDSEIEKILDAGRAVGVSQAGYVMLRLPNEVKDIFRQWLLTHYPDRYRHVMSLVKSMHGGKDYDAKWGKRMSGQGPYAWMVGRRFEKACERAGIGKRHIELRTDLFQKPAKQSDQLSLFDMAS
ncbi:MAG: radical SAM protein [Hyphomicrobiales bacterium]|nr:MAG: radical SAM protein [Hyphomicrobiales bacterium]